MTTHGLNQYKHGCRCDTCRTAKSVENRLVRDRRRQRAVDWTPRIDPFHRLEHALTELKAAHRA